MVIQLSKPLVCNPAIVAADVQSLSLDAGRVAFKWLDAEGNPVDIGVSNAPLAAEFPLTLEDVRAAIEAAGA